MSLEKPPVSFFGIDRSRYFRLTSYERRRFDSKVRVARRTYLGLRESMEAGPLGSSDAPVVMTRTARKQFESIVSPAGKKSDSSKLVLETFFFAWLKVKPKGEKHN